MDLGTYNNFTVSTKDPLKAVKAEILKEIQVTNKKTTAAWVHWRIVNNVYPCAVGDIDKLLQRTRSKAKQDKISFSFAFNILTTCTVKNATKK